MSVATKRHIFHSSGDACLPGECSEMTIPADARAKNRLLLTHNKRFMEPWFGVIADGTAGPSQTKKKQHLAHV